MQNVLFRADGSQQVGMGHLMRCLALADALRQQGVTSLFVARDDKAATDLLRRQGATVETVPGESSMHEDLARTLSLAADNGSGIIVSDLCNSKVLANPRGYEDYLAGLKGSGAFLVAMDDHSDACDLRIPADVIINPNYGTEDVSYTASNPRRLLLGHQYLIFRQEFIARAVKRRRIRPQGRRVLVLLGATDVFSVTPRVCQAAERLSRTSEIDLCIVTGMRPATNEHRQLKQILGTLNGSYRIMYNSDIIADLMLWADLAIISGGLAKNEAAITGTPGIIICQSEMQAQLVRKFEQEGTALNLGIGKELEEETIGVAIQRVLDDVSLRKEMSSKGRKLFDGRGAQRILASMREEVCNA